LRPTREKGIADHKGEKREDEEVVKLEPVADYDGNDCFKRYGVLNVSFHRSRGAS
jgi:hypothetical protein